MTDQGTCTGRHQPPGTEARVLPCHLLIDHPLRNGFYDQAHLSRLMVSIEETGLLEWLLVRPVDGHYQVLSGHYRLRAVRRLRWEQVPCRVQQCDQHTAYALFCTSNRFTRCLSALEEAQLLVGLVQSGYTFQEAGALWGRSKSWVSRRLKLLTALDPGLRPELAAGRLGPRVAQELARLPRGNTQAEVLSLIRERGLNKDEAAHLVDRWLTGTFQTPDWGEELAISDRLRRATREVARVSELLREKGRPPWWPPPAHQTLLQAVQLLELAGEGEHASSGT